MNVGSGPGRRYRIYSAGAICVVPGAIEGRNRAVVNGSPDRRRPGQFV